jgi:hypothetical protein
MSNQKLQNYIAEVDTLLGKHYMIGVNDVGEDIVISSYNSNESAQECVDWIGEKYNLWRTE